ncbi:hypothetical protein [Arthrobacter sp. TMS2-4]
MPSPSSSPEASSAEHPELGSETPTYEPSPPTDLPLSAPSSTTVDEAIARFNAARDELGFAPVVLNDKAGHFLQVIQNLEDEEKKVHTSTLEVEHNLSPLVLSHMEQEDVQPVSAPELLDAYFTSLLEPPLSEEPGWEEAMKSAVAVGLFTEEETVPEEPNTQNSVLSLFGKPTPVFSATPPRLDGVSQVGQTVVFEQSGFTAGAVLSLQWFRDSVPIDGASGVAYELLGEDLGREVSVQATLTREGWNSTVSVYALPEVVQPGTLVAPIVSIAGTPKVGSTLIALPGVPGPVPATITYEWKRGGSLVAGSKTSTYSLTSEDVGHQLTVIVTASAPGYESISASSAPTPQIEGVLTAPTPVINGTATVGSKLTVSPGSWTPGPVDLAYSWFANGLPISGASSATYAPSTAVVGKSLTVRVTGQKPGYPPVSRTSTPTSPVTLPPLVSPVPKIIGPVLVGSKLTVSTGAWGPAPVALTYAWYANGVRITGASSSSYVPTPAMLGKRLALRVTGTKAGFASAGKLSATTVPVAKVEEIPPTPTEAGSRSGWNSIARDMFHRMESDPDGQPEYASWTYAYQARMSAEYRGWKHPTTQQYLTKVYSLRKADGGYGLGKSWDAFSDGSVNPVSTTYTVSTADHVGEVLLAGYLAGAVPRAELVSAVDSLLSTPIDDTPNGKCMAYSTSLPDRPSKSGCVVNVSLGAAAFLSKVADSGALEGDPPKLVKVFQVVSQLKWLGIETYNEKGGGWAYLYLPSGNTPFGRPPVQDANHNAYTFESAVTLYGRKWLSEGMATWLAKPPTYPAYFDITGRVRQQSLSPSVYGQNALRDAAFVSANVTLRTQYAQLGMWSMRLARTATLHSMQWRPTAALSPIGVFNSNGARLSTTVRKGSRVSLRSTVLSGNGGHNINQTVKLAANSTYSTQKTSGHQGNIAFSVIVSRNSCYSLSVSKEYTTTKSPAVRTICFKVT